MTDRERFEAWVKSLPIRKRHRVDRTSDDSVWQGAYNDPAVQLAWEAWCAAQRTGIEDIGKALKETGAGMEDDEG